MANCTFKKCNLVLGPKGSRDNKKVGWMKDQTHQVRTESWFPPWQVLRLERAQGIPWEMCSRAGWRSVGRALTICISNKTSEDGTWTCADVRPEA